MMEYGQALEVHAALNDRASVERIMLEHTRFERGLALRGLSTPQVCISAMARYLLPSLRTADDSLHMATQMWNDPSIEKRLVRRSAADQTAIVAGLPTVWASPDLMRRAAEMRADQRKMPARESLPFPDGCVVVFGEPFTDSVSTSHAMVYLPLDDRAVMQSYVLNASGLYTMDLVASNSYDAPLAPGAPDNILTDIEDIATSEVCVNLLWLLSRHPDHEDLSDVRVAVTEVTDRSARRSAKKRGAKPEVNVIYLKAEKKALLGSGAHGSPSRHRVRAHWRWQPYGPGRSLRKWVLVREHERGQGECDDREKVYVAGRA